MSIHLCWLAMRINYKCSIYIHIICTATWTLLFLQSEEQNLVYDGTHLQKIMSEDQSKSLFDSAYHIINIKSQSKLSEQSLLQFFFRSSSTSSFPSRKGFHLDISSNSNKNPMSHALIEILNKNSQCSFSNYTVGIKFIVLAEKNL